MKGSPLHQGLAILGGALFIGLGYAQGIWFLRLAVIITKDAVVSVDYFSIRRLWNRDAKEVVSRVQRVDIARVVVGSNARIGRVVSRWKRPFVPQRGFTICLVMRDGRALPLPALYAGPGRPGFKRANALADRLRQALDLPPDARPIVPT